MLKTGISTDNRIIPKLRTVTAFSLAIVIICCAFPAFSQTFGRMHSNNERILGVSLGLNSYNSYFLTDGKKKLGPPYFRSSLPAVQLFYRARNNFFEHKLNIIYNQFSDLAFDDGLGNNHTNNEETSSCFIFPVDYSFIWYGFNNNPYVGIGPLVSVSYRRESIDYYSTGKENHNEFRTAVGINCVFELHFNQKYIFIMEFKNQQTLNFLSFGRYKQNILEGNSSIVNKYEPEVFNSELSFFISRMFREDVWFGLGFSWNEFVGSGNRKGGLDLHSNYRCRFFYLSSYIFL